MDNSHNNNILDSNGLKPFWNCWIFWAIDLTNMHWVILGRRQLRPNIFLSRAEGGHAKLGDFGLSTQLAGPWEGWMTMGTSFAKGLRSFLWLRQGEFLGNFGEIFPIFCSFPPKRRLETNILFVFWLVTKTKMWLCMTLWLHMALIVWSQADIASAEASASELEATSRGHRQNQSTGVARRKQRKTHWHENN